jgi:hypothetical protein
MGPAMLLWYEAELAYRRDGIKADWARSRGVARPSRSGAVGRRPVVLGWFAAHGLHT